MLSGSALEKFLDIGNVVVVGFFEESQKDEQAVFQSVASNIDRDELFFAQTSNEADMAKYQIQNPGVILFKKFDNKKDVYKGEITEKAITDFVSENAFPLLADLDIGNHDSYLERKIPIGYFFHDRPEVKLQFEDTLKHLALEHHGKISFVWVDASKVFLILSDIC